MDFKAKAREIAQRELKAYHVSPRQGVERFDIYQAIEDALQDAFEAGGNYEQVRSDRQPLIGQAIACKGIIDATTGTPVVRRVLGALPVTADGAVIGTNAVVYSWWEPQYSEGNGMVQMGETGCIVSAPHGCYSTREAAESARGRA